MVKLRNVKITIRGGRIMDSLDKRKDIPLDNIPIEVSPEEFNAFKHDLKRKDKQGAYRLIHIQRTAYRLFKQALDHNKDVTGKELTPEEREHMEIIVKQVIADFMVLKKEYEFNHNEGCGEIDQD